jgi:hypothetical protein
MILMIMEKRGITIRGLLKPTGSSLRNSSIYSECRILGKKKAACPTSKRHTASSTGERII